MRSISATWPQNRFRSLVSTRPTPLNNSHWRHRGAGMERSHPFVITVDGQSIQVDVCTKEQRSAVVFGVDHENHTEGALELHMVEDLMVDHDRVIFGLHFFKAREVVPVDLAVIGVRTTWSWALGSLVEIAEIGVDTQFANLMQPQVTDTSSEFLFAVIAIGEDIA